MPVNALLVVPPLLKTGRGPLLGPAMLVGAGRTAGHRVSILDLNAELIAERLHADCQASDAFLGDHDRPSAELRAVMRAYEQSASCGLPPREPKGDMVSIAVSLPYGHVDVLAGATTFADSAMGAWMCSRMAQAEVPDVVGVSVMHAGQVLAGLAVSLHVRLLWPRATVVWGGAHVTALRHEIAGDAAYGALVDRFVFGYAERTWVELLDALACGRAFPPQVVRAGCGCAELARDDGAVVPIFDLSPAPRTGRLTLPVQASRGCAYGACSFCTYPAVEGDYRGLGTRVVGEVVAEARRAGAAVSFKDSLVTKDRLEALAKLIRGHVPWSACTKLHRDYDNAFLTMLAEGGCKTLEIGLETLAADGQRVIRKKQRPETFLRFLDGAAAAGVSVVVNYMTGLPHVDRREEAEVLAAVQRELAARVGLVAKLEHNEFQLERLSPMGRNPAAHGLRVTQAWPWESVLAWESRSTCGQRPVGGARPRPLRPGP